MCCWLASPALSFCSRGATGQNDCLELLLMDPQQQSFPREGLCAARAFSVPPTRGTYCSQLKHSPNSANVQQKRLRKQYWFHESRIKITRHCLTRGIRKLWGEKFDCLQRQQMPATCHNTALTPRGQPGVQKIDCVDTRAVSLICSLNTQPLYLRMFFC